jgi:DNA-binding MurR/RpiR family transcriptional regulator
MVPPKEFKKLIADAYPTLTNNQKKVADYLLDNMREAAFLSVTDIGAKAGASKATVVRFAQQIGFDGFFDFRDRMNEAVNSEYINLTQLPLKADNTMATLFQVAKQDVDNINETINNIDRHVFLDAIQVLNQAGMVYTCGLGVSHLLSQLLAYSLSQVSIRSVSLRHDHQVFVEQLNLLTPNDVLVVFSFPPYSVETIDLAAAAKKNKIKVISITNKLTSPVAEFSDVTLSVKSENMIFTNSIASVSMIINALATEIAIQNKNKALRHVQNTQDYLEKTGHFYKKD